MTKAIYQKLGLSEIDVKLIEKYRLTYLLEKIRDQQNELQEQKDELERVLSKLKENLNAARDAQLCLLPDDNQQIENIEFCARFYPSQFVSGDIYNIFRLDEDNIGLYHIDISGHGVPAALFSVSLSRLLSANISARNFLKIPVEHPPYYIINPPNKVIAALDEDHPYENAGIFFTMIYMLVNIKKRQISFTRAGHNPPIIIKKNGDFLMPTDGSFPIGWELPRDDKVITIQLDKGDRALLYSDGVTEAIDHRGQMFTVDRIVDSLLKNRDKTLTESLDILVDELHRYTGALEFEDDVSIVGFEIK
jgi:sigma-B regulation protein RsbU (phosphoserine phosphatase)